MAKPKMVSNDPFEHYTVLNARRRVLLILLAVATAVTVFWLLLYRPGGVKPVRHVSPCVEDGTTRCPGGKADVILLPQGDAAAPPALAASQ
jgi:hypothetical protein